MGVPSSPPLLFEAAAPATGSFFTLDGYGEAVLRLSVPEQFAQVLSDNIHRLRHTSFVVEIHGLADTPQNANRTPRKRAKRQPIEEAS